MRTMILMALVACKTGKDLENGPHCEDVATVVGVDEQTELGFAAADLLGWAEAVHSPMFTWDRDGTTTDLTITVTAGSEARFVDSEAVYPDSGEQSPAIGVICDDRVEVDVSVAFATADGAFAEMWDVALWGVASDAAHLRHELDPDGLTGSYDMAPDIQSSDYHERSLWVDGVFDGAGTQGAVTGSVSGSDPCDGDTCSAWAEEVSVGLWGPGPM